MKFLILAIVPMFMSCATMMTEDNQKCNQLRTCQEISSQTFNPWVLGNVVTWGLTAIVDYSTETINRCDKKFNPECLKNSVCKQDMNCVKSITSGELYMGMSEDAMRLSWGEPEKINETATKYSVRRQNIYKTHYVYTKNGVVESWSNR